MVQFEIFFSDLNEQAQQDLLDMVGAESPEDMNWDFDLVPIAIVDFEEVEEVE